jgi:hypothetical protein
MGCIAFLDKTEGEMCSHILAVGRWHYIYVQAGETGFIATISYIEIERLRSLNPISGFATPRGTTSADQNKPWTIATQRNEKP